MPRDIENLSPGQELQLLLKEIYPIDSSDKGAFLTRLDDALMADNDINKFAFTGC